MEIIYDARQTGRTNKLVEMVKAGRNKDLDNNRILIVRTEMCKKRILDKYNLFSYEVKTYNEMELSRPGVRMNYNELYLDDVDLYLELKLKSSVHSMSIENRRLTEIREKI